MSLSAKAIIGREGVGKIAAALDVRTGNVRMWKKRDRIPPEHWQEFAAKRLATLEELAGTLARAEAA